MFDHVEYMIADEEHFIRLKKCEKIVPFFNNKGRDRNFKLSPRGFELIAKLDVNVRYRLPSLDIKCA